MNRAMWWSLVNVAALLFPSVGIAADGSEQGRYSFSVKSGWNSHEDDAWQDALRHAQAHLAAHLRAQQPPIRSVPPLEQIRKEYVVSTLPIRSEWFATPINAKMYEVELELEVTPEQIRHLRAADRLKWLTRIGGVCWTFAVLTMLFFKLDDWAKGYITHWLGLAAVGILVMVTVVLFLI